jgi:peptidoglycan/xylan/chitin deacetylase (PgdA/CDA1 family)
MDVTVTTSWDDGHVLDLRLADLLSSHGLAATFYVAPRSVEIAEHLRLTDRQLRELGGRFEIGGHTLHHVRLPSVALQAADDEVRYGKSFLEDVLQTNVTSFCYPGGAYGPEHVDLVRRAGFLVARTVRRWVQRPASDLLQMGTTSHAYRHLKDVPALVNRYWHRPVRLVRTFRNWEQLAIDQFDETASAGGVFHLWGHSWEVDANDDWARLERVVRHIAGRSGVRYAPNGALAEESRPLLGTAGGREDQERSG